MRWEDERSSDNVQDDRGVSFGGGGGGGGLMFGGGGVGALVLVGLALLFGVDPRMLLQGGGEQAGVQTQEAGQPRADDEDARFSRVVMGLTEDTWGQVFQERGAAYDPPTLVLYDRGHPTGCGFGQSAMGPFYCPVDHRIYLDLQFFRELSGRFAEAYVIAHEVGHHVQNLLGVSERSQAAQQRAGKVEGNKVSVKVELQADCFAGVWAARTNQRRQILDPGDVEQGLAAASAVGDDTLQRQTQGQVVPDAFTHGTSEQRMRWFRRGFDKPSLESCDTFGVDYEAL